MTTDIDVVIVSFNCRQPLLAALDSLRRSTTPPRSVVVVDNGSGDGTVDAVRAGFPEVVLTPLGRNTGFAHAANAGIAAGTSRFVMLLNPDTVVAPDALGMLAGFAAAHPDAGVVAPSVLNSDGTNQLTARAFPSAAAGIFGRRSLLSRVFPNNPWTTRFLAGRAHDGDEPFPVDWVSGAAMLVPRDAVRSVGALDEGYFLFWEDADWCRRMAAAGRRVWCVPQATVVHAEGGSRDHGWSPRTIRWFHEGAYRYWRTYHAPSPWNPLRWAAAVLLAARATTLTAAAVLPNRAERSSRTVPARPIPESG